MYRYVHLGMILVLLAGFTVVFSSVQNASSLDTYVAPGESVHLHTDEGETFENVIVDENELFASASETTCEDVHNSFVTTGPDGNTYPTWHPMVVGECHFDHEHGNDPESVVPGFHPAFGYANAVHEMGESHHGYKVFAFADLSTPVAGREWVVVMHQGTTTDNALCGRFHHVSIAAFEYDVRKAELHTMTDFGQSRLGAGGAVMSPPKCDGDPTVPDLFQVNSTINSQSLRRIPTTDGLGQGYTPYIANQSFSELGLRIRASFLTTNGRTWCLNVDCDTLQINSNNAGDRRRLQTLGSEDESISINKSVTTTNSGTFTDSTGVIQFIEPGFSASMLVSRSERDAQGRNGMWYWDTDGSGGPLTKEQQPMRSATDLNNFNGSSLGFDIQYFGEN